MERKVGFLQHLFFEKMDWYSAFSLWTSLWSFPLSYYVCLGWQPLFMPYIVHIRVIHLYVRVELMHYTSAPLLIWENKIKALQPKVPQEPSQPE